MLRFARAVVAFVSLDRSSEIAPRVALGYPRVAPSPARRASRARANTGMYPPISTIAAVATPKTNFRFFVAPTSYMRFA